MSKSEQEMKNPISRSRNFFQESVVELKKVHVPTKQETLRATGAVLLMLTFVSIVLGIADSIFGWLMTKVLG